jgi:hypothetical protein
MKNNGTIWKAVFLLLVVALIASLTGNAILWRDFSALTTVPVAALKPGVASGADSATPAGERVSLLDRYAGMRDQINWRLGWGKDAQAFVTPDNPVVAAKVAELTSGDMSDPKVYWQNCEKLYRWVVQYIQYTPDSYFPVMPDSINGEIKWTADCWRTPEETIKDKAGDCEDMSCLLTSMLLNYNQHTYGTWVVIVRSKDGAHAGVVFPIQNGMITVVDPSIKYNTSLSEYGGVVNSKDAAVAMDDWLTKIQDKVPNAQVAAVFSDKFYREFSGTAEFLDWIKTNVK